MRSRTTISALAVVLMGAAAHAQDAQDLADGVYRRSSDASAPSVTSQDGKALSLGPVVEMTVGPSTIVAEDNANGQFWVQVAAPRVRFGDAFSSYVLVVADRGYPFIGAGSRNGSYTMDFRVFGVDRARQIARFLDASIVYRRHPGHELLVSFTPTKASFGAREEVTATFRIENIGTNAIAFREGGQYHGSSRDNQYEFSARLLGRQVTDIGNNSHMGGLAVTQVLEAGDVFEEEVSLSKWFAFDRPGIYEILGTYDLNFYDPDSDGFWPIWTDYVSSEFVVKIDD